MKSIAEVIGGMDKKIIGDACCVGCKEKITIYDMPIIGGPDKGKVQRFKKGCKCYNKKIAEKVMKEHKRLKQEKEMKRLHDTFNQHSLINKELQSKTLQDYIPQHEKQFQAKETTKQYINNFNPVESNNLVFCGPTGVGKSHLAKTISDGVIEKGYTSIFVSMPTLFRKLRSTYDKNSEKTEDYIYNIIEKVDLLILDDVGTEKDSEWMKERLFDLVNSRQGMSTIYTTNSKTDDLRKIVGDRISSRILNYSTKEVTILGGNYRDIKNR